MTRTAFVSILVLVAGCGSSSSSEPGASAGGEEEVAAQSSAEPSRVLEDGSRVFGDEPSGERQVTPLADILASPDRFEGQVVKTQGEISQVCQRMGCWMELRADEQTPGIRVPMAGHSFFLPRDVAGNRATIEGRVVVAQLSAEDRAHLESEGAQATGVDVSIEATGVVVHQP